MKLATQIMEITARLPPLAGPFAEKKFAPILAHNDLRKARRVLDVGCGPGTNTSHFAHTYYLGIDHNLRYLQHARRRHGRDFLVADITRPALAPAARFDFILINSFLHHMDTPSARGLLSQLSALLTEDGHVHILDLVLPAAALGRPPPRPPGSRRVSAPARRMEANLQRKVRDRGL